MSPWPPEASLLGPQRTALHGGLCWCQSGSHQVGSATPVPGKGAECHRGIQSASQGTPESS